MQQYFLSFLGVLFIGCFIELLSQNNKFKSYISLCTGLVIVLAMLSPLLQIYDTFIKNPQQISPDTIHAFTEAEYEKEVQNVFDFDGFVLNETQNNTQTEIETTLYEELGINAECSVSLQNDNGDVVIQSVSVYYTGEDKEEEIKNLLFDFYFIKKNNIYVIER